MANTKQQLDHPTSCQMVLRPSLAGFARNWLQGQLMPTAAASFTGHFCSLLPILRTLAITWPQIALSREGGRAVAAQVNGDVRRIVPARLCFCDDILLESCCRNEITQSMEEGEVRWVPFTGQFQPLTSLIPDGMNKIRSQYRPHGEFCLSGSCAVLHGSTSTESGPG